MDLLREQQAFLTAGLSLQSQARQFYLFVVLGLRVSSVKQSDWLGPCRELCRGRPHISSAQRGPLTTSLFSSGACNSNLGGMIIGRQGPTFSTSFHRAVPRWWTCLEGMKRLHLGTRKSRCHGPSATGGQHQHRGKASAAEPGEIAWALCYTRHHVSPYRDEEDTRALLSLKVHHPGGD